jgi:hypothetical protein
MNVCVASIAQPGVTFGGVLQLLTGSSQASAFFFRAP